MNLEQAARALDAYLDADIPAFLWGKPGIGKSDVVRQVAAKRGLPLIDLRATLLDPVDLRGLPTVADGATTWCTPDFWPRKGEGIIFADELNAAAPSVQVAFFQAILDRRIGEYVIPAGWRWIAAGNRQADRAAAQRMPSALANRFAHVDVDAEPKAFCAYAASVGMAPEVIAFIRFRPELLHKMDDSELRAFPTPRSWAQVAKVAGAPADIRYGLVSGLVGDKAAAEFEGFLKIWQTLPPLESIVRDPAGSKVPTEPGVQYAVSSALARYATRANFDAIMTYAKRLPPDFRTVVAIEATRRDSALQTTRAYVEWATSQGMGVAA